MNMKHPDFTSFCLPLGAAMFVVLSGCGGPSHVDTRMEADAIRKLDDRWMAALAAKDVEAISSLYAPDAVQLPANTPAVAGREAIHQWLTGWLPTPGMSVTFAIDTIEIAASGELAYERGTYRSVTETSQGRNEDVGKYLTIWKKIGVEWRVMVDTDNSDKPCTGS